MIYKNKEGEFIYVRLPKKAGRLIIPECFGDYQCKRIESEEFINWDELTEVVIPEGVISIGGFAFLGCSSLMNVNIPSSVINVKDWAFNKCSSLTNINIPSSVTNIEALAFKNCINLNVVINNSKNNVLVGKDAFYGCKSVTWLK